MQQKIKQVIVVRKDLNMRKGKIGAQSAHASRAIMIEDRKRPGHNPDLETWLETGQRTICLCIESEEALVKLHQKALSLGLESHLITDRGMTEFHGIPTKTCLAIGPHADEKFEGLTTGLQLY